MAPPDYPDPVAPGAPQPGSLTRAKKNKKAAAPPPSNAAKKAPSPPPAPAAKAKEPAPAANSQPASNLPIFYQSPRPLDKKKDADKRISRTVNFSFARNTNAIPILIDEFPLVSAYYPIVFAEGAHPIPAAVVGLEDDKNLFVGADGRWRAGGYLPAYVRRYPFILMDDPAQKQFVLCVDDASDLVGTEGDFPLFEKGEPGAFTKSMIEFCAALRRHGEETDRFVTALQEQDILVPYDAKLNLPDAGKVELSGFRVVDPQRFDSLPDSLIIDWRNRGWLSLVYAHLLSSHRWHNLADLMRKGK